MLNTAKQILFNLIEEMPEVIDFIGYLKLKKEKELYRDLISASESSLKFWDNVIDDEVWNDV